MDEIGFMIILSSLFFNQRGKKTKLQTDYLLFVTARTILSS